MKQIICGPEKGTSLMCSDVCPGGEGESEEEEEDESVAELKKPNSDEVRGCGWVGGRLRGPACPER